MMFIKENISVSYDLSDKIMKCHTLFSQNILSLILILTIFEENKKRHEWKWKEF